ncbi:hypothetical protein MMC22_002936 [Lobaria immixta]|nr:hypothetical protein [Lobaria immixta]
MSSTADRWFVPDHEYYNSIQDYAVVGYTTIRASEELSAYDSKRSHYLDDDATFMTEYDPRNAFDHNLRIRTYPFSHFGRLLYADVDDKNPAHKEKVYGEIAKEIPIEEKSEETTEIMEQLVKTLAPIFYKLDDVPENEKKLVEENREGWTLIDLEELIEQRLLNKHIVSCILTAKTVEEKEEILNLFSGQTRTPTKRPVLSLISMIDSMQTTEPGETRGWVTGYDFINDLLLIKPFVSKGGKHPLAEKWHGDVAQDGVSFSGTLRDFAKAYIEWGKRVDAVDEHRKHDGFKMIVHTHAAEWIDACFETVNAAEFHVDRLAIQEVIGTIKKAMEKIEFPIVEKKEKDCGFELSPFRRILNMVETEEPLIRGIAVEAKKLGEEKIARNIARLYESVHNQIKAFNENPFMDL